MAQRWGGARGAAVPLLATGALLAAGALVACAPAPTAPAAPSTPIASGALAHGTPSSAGTAPPTAAAASTVPGATSAGSAADCRDSLPEGSFKVPPGVRRMPDGVVLLGAAPPPPPVTPVAGTTGWTWTPPSDLPAPDPSRTRPVDVVYTPHPDDETLSMGVLIAKDTRAGHRVMVVSLTDGRSTGAGKDIDARRRAADPKAGPLTPDEIAQDRVRELRRASARLGVAAGDVVLAHLDAPGSDCGTRVTVAEAQAVMRVVAQRFPGADQVTMSGVNDRHPDHLAAGQALAALVREGVVTSATWTVSRLWWELPGPPPTTVLPDAAEAAMVRAAGKEYQLWDPAHSEYAVGLYSVRWQFAALQLDPRNRYRRSE